MNTNRSPGLAPGASDTLQCPPDRVCILRIAEICRRTALSPSSIYGLIAGLQFPLLLELGVRARGLVHGHVPVEQIACTANRWNIDTGAGIPRLDRLSFVEVNAPMVCTWTFVVDESC